MCLIEWTVRVEPDWAYTQINFCPNLAQHATLILTILDRTLLLYLEFYIL